MIKKLAACVLAISLLSTSTLTAYASVTTQNSTSDTTSSASAASAKPTYAKQPAKGYATLAQASNAFPGAMYCTRYRDDNSFGWFAVSKEDYARFKTGFDTREQIAEVFGAFTPYFDNEGFVNDCNGFTPGQAANIWVPPADFFPMGYDSREEYVDALRRQHTYEDVYCSKDGKWFLDFEIKDTGMLRDWDAAQWSWSDYCATVQSLMAAYPDGGYYEYVDSWGTWRVLREPRTAYDGGGVVEGPFASEKAATEAAQTAALSIPEGFNTSYYKQDGIQVWQNEYTGKWFSKVKYASTIKFH